MRFHRIAMSCFIAVFLIFITSWLWIPASYSMRSDPAGTSATLLTRDSAIQAVITVASWKYSEKDALVELELYFSSDVMPAFSWEASGRRNKWSKGKQLPVAVAFDDPYYRVFHISVAHLRELSFTVFCEEDAVRFYTNRMTAAPVPALNVFDALEYRTRRLRYEIDEWENRIEDLKGAAEQVEQEIATLRSANEELASQRLFSSRGRLAEIDNRIENNTKHIEEAEVFIQNNNREILAGQAAIDDIQKQILAFKRGDFN